MPLLNKLTFAAVEFPLLPVTVAAYLFSTARIAVASRRDNTSMTAASPLGVRWLLHETGQREDEAAGRLFSRLPGISEMAARLVLRPTTMASRLSGHTPAILRYPLEDESNVVSMFNARTTFFHRALVDSLPRVTRVVVLGAGWDTRAFGLPETVRVFEVDAPDTQGRKRALLAECGIDAAGVTFTSVDFNRESWLNRIAPEEFDPSRPTFVLWEGVTYHLEPEAVAANLDAVSDLTPGSRGAFDYFTRAWVEGSDAPLFVRVMRPALRLTGEEWTFGIPTTPDPRSEADRFVDSRGLVLKRWTPCGERQEPFDGLVLAAVPSDPLAPAVDRAHHG